jgi:4-amino-4-deoxy-L-arabinose transferase-like glycosyltransferase
MTAVADVPAAHADSSARPAWRLDWLTPRRCRMLLAIVLVLGAVLHVRYLTHDCPIDLSGDEAQYWDWSRQLEPSYYSKGPAVAYIIRASTDLFGNTMPAVRYPALLFSIGTSLVTYLLTRELFRSEKLALGAVLLNHIVPMFVAGSVLMTIDPPMFFCWALATWLGARAIFAGKRASWPLAGLAIGLGFLAKYAALLWWPAVGLFFLVDKPSRKHLRSPLLWLGVLISLACTSPVILWNANHDWVSYRHVATQTGATGHSHGNLFEFLGTQFLVIGPVLAVMMVLAIIETVGDFVKTRHLAPGFALDAGAMHSIPAPESALAADLLPQGESGRRGVFLATIGLLFFILTTIVSLFAKAQVNWPAPAYFTLMILTAWWISTRLRSVQTWKPWRWWFWGTVAFALIAMPLTHDPSLVFPIISKVKVALGRDSAVDAGPFDKLLGWQKLGDHVTRQLQTLGDGAFVVCDDYMQTAETAFYVAGQPKTYCMGSYYVHAKRLTQYDMWPDRSLAQEKLIGKNAVYVGKGGTTPPDLARAFARVEPLPELPIVLRGVTVKTFKTWRCYGFKGLSHPGGRGDF